MSKQKSYFKKSILMCGVCALALPIMGCSAEHGPFSMPTGYHYHTDNVRSATGPRPMIDKPIHKEVPQLMPFNEKDNFYSERTAVYSGPDAPMLLGTDDGAVLVDPAVLFDKTTRGAAPQMLQPMTDEEMAAMETPLPPPTTIDPTLSDDPVINMVPPGEDKVDGNLYLSINHLIRNLSFATDEPIIAVYLKPSRASDRMEELKDLEFSIRNGFMANGIEVLPEQKDDELVAEYWLEKKMDKDELHVNLMFGKRTLAEESVILGEAVSLDEPTAKEPEERPIRKTRPSGGPLLLTPQG